MKNKSDLLGSNADSTLETQNELESIEARLIAQDHRIFHIAWNFITSRKWPVSDDRRIAALSAVIWKIFAPGNAVLGGAAIISYLSYTALVSQNVLIQDQLKLSRETYLESRQIDIFKALYDKDSGEAANNERIREEAFLEYINRTNREGAAFDGAITLKPHLRDAYLNDLDIRDAAIKDFDISGSNLSGSQFKDGTWNNVIAHAVSVDDIQFNDLNISDSVMSFVKNLDAKMISLIALKNVNMSKSTMSMQGVDTIEIQNTRLDSVKINKGKTNVMSLNKIIGDGDIEINSFGDGGIFFSESRLKSLSVNTVGHDKELDEIKKNPLL